ncbi:Sec-independent protein translocase subunit TatA [Pseudonocardia abyssalis]|jgi:sec-independent protein translocase protein TatA|uniref:Sec-independent protein translocase protein TatA n=1 Tax=Pseudonocardia abyssalis TaxID=2792008 RepID=A0ABS6UPN8_9PSEU|nr:Sec-independent protein translocase subunit TatA [Pseudonocardia abyssalis]MBW0134147.1 Sec-independent protein translocase subunit TatA [Pseudonocardia abyssalis]
MPSLGGWEFVILIGILVLLFGAKRLPDMARSIGQSARVFKGEMKGMKEDGSAKDAPADPPPAAAPAPPAPLPPAATTPVTPPVQAAPPVQEPTPATGQGHSTSGQ